MHRRGGWQPYKDEGLASWFWLNRKGWNSFASVGTLVAEHRFVPTSPRPWLKLSCSGVKVSVPPCLCWMFFFLLSRQQWWGTGTNLRMGSAFFRWWLEYFSVKLVYQDGQPLPPRPEVTGAPCQLQKNCETPQVFCNTSLPLKPGNISTSSCRMAFILSLVLVPVLPLCVTSSLACASQQRRCPFEFLWFVNWSVGSTLFLSSLGLQQVSKDK